MNNIPKNLIIGGFTLKVIDFLAKHPTESFTIDNIRKLVKGSNYATIYRKVHLLVKQGILLKSLYGMASQIRINLDNNNTISLLSFIEAEKFKEFYKNLRGDIKTAISEIIKDASPVMEIKCAIIFGSYAKGNQTTKSDLDILIAYNKSNLIKNLSYDEEIKKTIMSIIKTSELRGGPKINPIIVNEEEHSEMIFNNQLNIGKETLLNHIILKGYEEYWRGIGNAVKERS